MSENIDKLERRIATLERIIRYAKIVSGIVGACLIAFLGHQSFQGIPNAIEEKWTDEYSNKFQAELETIEAAADVATELSEQVRNQQQLIESYSSVPGVVPIGGIIPIATNISETRLYEILPKNWVLCDGELINQEHPRQFQQNEVSASLWNTRAPDLQDRFIMGWSTNYRPLETGGANANSHTHSGKTENADSVGDSQGAGWGSHNGTQLPEEAHGHTFSTASNSDLDEPYSNAPAFMATYFVMRVN